MSFGGSKTDVPSVTNVSDWNDIAMLDRDEQGIEDQSLDGIFHPSDFDPLLSFDTPFNYIQAQEDATVANQSDTQNSTHPLSAPASQHKQLNFDISNALKRYRGHPLLPNSSKSKLPISFLTDPEKSPAVNATLCEGSPTVTSKVYNSCMPWSPTIKDNSEIDLPSAVQGESPLSINSTLSSITDDGMDWGEGEFNATVQDSQFPGFSAISTEGLMEDCVLRPFFSPMKQEMINRIMEEFWAIFEQESGSIRNPSPVPGLEGSDSDNADTPCDGGEGSSKNPGSELPRGASKTSQNSPMNILTGRKRKSQDDEEQSNGEERGPKRPRKLPSPPQNQDDRTNFACPYRKRDPRKYCIQHWRSCALTPLETVARVKGHLYRHHRIFPCQRCKNHFKDQDAVNLHLKEPKGCELRDVEQADGITTEIVEKLRSKKRLQRDQTEADRWKDIYKLLFPNEMIPSPYFEPVQEEVFLSPDERGLADYEDYCRRELPRDFRAALEKKVYSESQPIEESIRNQLQNIIRDCQDRVFSRYRSLTTPVGTPSKNLDTSHSPRPPSQDNISVAPDAASKGLFAALPLPFFQPPPPQTHLHSSLEISDLPSNIFKAPEGSDQSDSGYGSSSLVPNSEVYSSFQNPGDSGSNPQSLAVLESVLDDTQAAQESENDLLHSFDYSLGSHEIAAVTFDNFGYHDPELVDQSDWNV